VEIVENRVLRGAIPKEVATEISKRVERMLIYNEGATDSDVLINWDQEEAENAAFVFDSYTPKLKLPPLPSPILRDYNWPGVFTPFEHQRTTASFLSLRRRAFCFNEAGTGKTSSAIWAADYLMRIGKIRRALIICPLSIMHTAWQADIIQTAMHRSVGVAYGSVERRKVYIEGPYDFVIINYDGIPTVLDEIKKAKFDLIIVDEANAYKNASTKRWKSLAKILTPQTWLWMMTGTPAAQSPMDAFGLAKMVSPYRVPKFSTAWRDKVLTQVSKFRWLPKPGAKQIVYEALQPAIRYTKKECLDLPEVTYQTREIPLTLQVIRYYKELKSQALVEAAGEEISAVNAAAMLTKLLQISGGAVYSDDRLVIEFDVSPRLAALKETLDETVNKAIVFVPYLHTLDIIVEYLNKEGYTNEVIKGEVPILERKRIVEEFQKTDDLRVLIMQPQSASHGLTLTRADTLVFWSPVMSVDTYIQCIGRIDRLGQKFPCTVVHLQGSEAEKRVYSMLLSKLRAHNELVDMYDIPTPVVDLYKEVMEVI
jgi:SNF2 family DNA or RNA helicase